MSAISNVKAKLEGQSDVDEYQPSPPVSARTFAMVMFLSAIVMLFAGLISAFIVLRFQAGENWPPEGFPRIPVGLWIPTAIAVASSVSLAMAQRSARAGDKAALVGRLAMTTLLGFAFVAAQVLLWKGMFAAGLDIKGSLYGANFYALSGTHAVHVVGGLVMLLVMLVKASRGAYTETSDEGLTSGAMYWHFVGGLWLFLFAALYLA